MHIYKLYRQHTVSAHVYMNYADRVHVFAKKFLWHVLQNKKTLGGFLSNKENINLPSEAGHSQSGFGFS